MSGETAQYKKPRTIQELQTFCTEKGMPLERMRFFIGTDCREPRAFGICRTEEGDFLVYKNKADGTRAVRYRGPDEAYAVNEIYEKLKSELQLRLDGYSAREWTGGAAPAPRQVRRASSRDKIVLGILAVMAAVLVLRSVTGGSLHRQGYYEYGGHNYYYYASDWYDYDPELGYWTEAGTLSEEFAASPEDYYVSRFYDEEAGVPDFTDSEYYWVSYSSDDDDYDWDSGYDYDDWDYGDTDWDSDW